MQPQPQPLSLLRISVPLFKSFIDQTEHILNLQNRSFVNKEILPLFFRQDEIIPIHSLSEWLDCLETLTEKDHVRFPLVNSEPSYIQKLFSAWLFNHETDIQLLSNNDILWEECSKRA